MDVADSNDSVSTEKVRCTIVDIDPTTSEQKSVSTQSKMSLPNNTEEMGAINEGRIDQRDEVTDSIKQTSAVQSQTEELPHLEPNSMEVDSLENVSVQFYIGNNKEAKIPGGSPLLKAPPESSASVSSVEETTESLALSKEAMKIPEKLEKTVEIKTTSSDELAVDAIATPMKSSSRLSGRRSVDFTGTPRRSSSRLSEKISTEEEDSTRSEILWTLYQSTKSNNTQLAKCHQNERLKSAKLANDVVVLKKQLMDSVTECSILKAQISKWEQLKKATQCICTLGHLRKEEGKDDEKVDSVN
ncbi:uncharacterized protein LOC136030581 [Artemia franciscana]